MRRYEFVDSFGRKQIFDLDNIPVLRARKKEFVKDEVAELINNIKRPTPIKKSEINTLNLSIELGVNPTIVEEIVSEMFQTIQ